MPSNQNPLGALPSRFRRQRVLIVGCGDVGQRSARLMPHLHVLALVRDGAQSPALRALGIRPLRGDLDDPATLSRLSGLAHRVLHLAPPPAPAPAPASSSGSAGENQDRRTRALVQVLRRRSPPQALVYGSTTGVYGDCAGAWVDESRPIAPATARARRRADAEWVLRQGAGAALNVRVLRIPGIYAPDREGGTPRKRLLARQPVLCPADDVYTNHIHADDLARACLLALWRLRAQRVLHISDQSDLKMGDYFDQAADLYGLARPPRIARSDAPSQLTPLQLSFMGESRRLRTTRMQRELRLRLRYPTTADGLRSGAA